MEYPFGIDISKYQHGDGSEKVKYGIINQKCSFVAMRAGISWGYIDPKFHESWGNIYVPRLAYHVIYPGENGENQADHFLNIVKPKEHDRLVIDAELAHGLNKEKITDTYLDVINYIWDAIGAYPIMYSRADWVNTYLDVTRLPKLDWWLAGYLKRRPYPEYTPELPPPPALPRGLNNWLIHQTGEKGKGEDVGVLSYYVDTNRWNGTEQDLLAYFGLEEPAPPPLDEKLFDAKVYAWATPYVNVRKEPDINSKDLGDILPGKIVGVYGELPEWYKLADGYAMKKFLEPLPNTPPVEPPVNPKLFDARVYSWATPHVNIRKEPDIKSRDVGDILPNAIVPVYGDLGTWYELNNGFVMKQFLEKLSPTEDILIDIPPLWQIDPRWKNKLLGNSNLTIGGWGCLITNLSEIAGVTPDVFNDRLKAVGGFAGANVYWGMVSVAFPNIQYLKSIDCYYDPAPLNIIDDYLRAGTTSLVQVDLDPLTPQMDQHWIHINGKNGNDYIANDPWIGKRISFREVYGDPARWIFRIRVYKNNKGV